MKLDIIVTRYRETWFVCKDLFDSIALQRGLPLDLINVTVVNDGLDDILDDTLFETYPYAINYVKKPHEGVSAARQYGFDHTENEYVMFCDIDDMFLNNYALHTIFGAMQEGYDAIASAFIEEQPRDNGWKIFRHDNDCTFVHGKIYKREYLIRENIKWNPALTKHEDGYFNRLALTLTKNIKTINTPLYLWKWHLGSVCRVDYFTLRTYEHLLMAKTALIENFQSRGMEREARLLAARQIIDSYYDSCKNYWERPENARYVKDAKKAMKAFYKVFGHYYHETDDLEKAELFSLARQTANKNGMYIEKYAFRDWLKAVCL